VSVRISDDAARRVVRATRASEKRPEAPAVGDRRIPKTPQVRPAMLAKLLTTVSARTGTDPTFTLGSGTAKPYWLDDATAQTSAVGSNITVYNVLDVDIPALPGPVVLLWVDGLYIVAVGDCYTP
jgi:hypothetical protein